ncbi:protein-tyrosine phosphatase-like protein, partial [Pterulicium gracile]
SSPAPSLTPPADDEPTQIFPRLFISSLSTAESSSIICAHRITHILTIHRLAPPILSTSHPIERMHLPLTDTPFTDLLCHLPSTTQWIHDSLTSSPDSRVLVHCEMGISRSTSVVVGYIMWARGCAVDEAVGMVKEKRAVARPNEGFLTQLGEWRE